jgi:folate-binding protein YgfZ
MSDHPVANGVEAPLAELFRRRGAVVGQVGSVSTPTRFADPGAEYEALVSGCALADRSWSDWLEIRDEDRVRFVNGLVTCDVKSLEPGRSSFGFFTSTKGKILSDVVVSALEDRLLLELPPQKASEIREHMERYIVADRVEVLDAEAAAAVLVAGPAALQRLEDLFQAQLGDGDWLEGPPGPEGVLLRRERRLGLEAWVLRLEPTVAADKVATLLASGCVPVGLEAVTTVRVERGIPWFGFDYGPENFPQETGLEEQGVSYTKGCYLGQEVVARIHYRGKVNYCLRGLLLSSEGAPRQGAPLRFEGRTVGSLTSPVRSRRLGRWIGLTLVHRQAAEPGTKLEIEDGGWGEVVEPPFDQPS